jgi:hypothetical protein
MLPPKVSRSTIAAQSLGSVKVLVQPSGERLVGSDRDGRFLAKLTQVEDVVVEVPGLTPLDPQVSPPSSGGSPARLFIGATQPPERRVTAGSGRRPPRAGRVKS